MTTSNSSGVVFVEGRRSASKFYDGTSLIYQECLYKNSSEPINFAITKSAKALLYARELLKENNYHAVLAILSIEYQRIKQIEFAIEMSKFQQRLPLWLEIPSSRDVK